MEDVEIVGACNLQEDKLEETCNRYSISGRFTDYRQMLDQLHPDAVYIIMPPHHLYDLTIDCLEMGLNVFIEKPPGITTHQTTWMAKYAKKNGVIGMVGWNRRFIPVVNYCREKVLSYNDNVQQVVSTFYKYYPGSAGPYYRGAVDILHCDAVHAVDTLRWLAGAEVVNVASVVDHLPGNCCVGILAKSRPD